MPWKPSVAVLSPVAVITRMNRADVQGFDLSDFSALLVGCGGLGCNAAVHLVGSGIGKLYLCDFDTVSEGNLNRQFLFTPEDIGKNKAEVTAKRLSTYSRDTEYIVLTKRIDRDFSPLPECDVILCAVDNSDTRHFLEEVADRTDTPLVIGGVNGFYGIAYLYLPKKSLSPERAAVFEGRDATYSVSSTCGIAGSTMSALAVRYLLTKNEALGGKLLVYDEYKFDTLSLKG